MDANDGSQIDRLEQKMEDRFALARAESRADFRFLLGAIVAILMTMTLVVAGILLQVG